MPLSSYLVNINALALFTNAVTHYLMHAIFLFANKAKVVPDFADVRWDPGDLLYKVD
jgi:hypothetical protein